jgi:hypothetical protein
MVHLACAYFVRRNGAAKPLQPVDDVNRPCYLVILPIGQSVRRYFDQDIRINPISLETAAI